MNKFLCLSISFCYLSALAFLACPMPAIAQGQRSVPASGYGTGENIQISGWETDLVRRNKGLEKFHWSPINTVQRYRVVAAGSAQKPAAGTVTAYQSAKPRVVSNWSNTKGLVAEKSCAANATNSSQTGVNAHFIGANPSSYWSIGQGYETKPYNYKRTQYSGNVDRQVSARVMHY
jgi:hypothetical protein